MAGFLHIFKTKLSYYSLIRIIFITFFFQCYNIYFSTTCFTCIKYLIINVLNYFFFYVGKV